MASAMVACTILSAPLMFVSAKMITLTKLNPGDYVSDLDTFLLNMSIIGLIAAVNYAPNLTKFKLTTSMLLK